MPRLAFVLAALRAQYERELRSDDVREQFSHRTRRLARARVQLLFGQSTTCVEQGEIRPPVVAKTVRESLAHPRSAPVLPRRVAARLAARGERERHVDRLLRRLREVQLGDLRFLEVLAPVGDLADA